MNRLVGLSVLAVALAAAGTSAAQDTGTTDIKAAEQTPVTTENPVTTTTEQTSAQATPEASVTKQPGDTHVRIVRLSQVQGKVGMDRGTGHGVEPATQNMPIVENMLLGTADDDSYAEVEFEDGSAIRLGPGTAVKFVQLVTRASGAKATTVRVDRGTVYVNRERTKPDEFTLLAAGTEKLTVSPATHMRLELMGTRMALAVFSGDVAVEGSGAPMTVGKKQALSLDLADKSGQVELAKKVEEGPFDGWDKDAQQYHERYAKGNSLLGGYGYGISDLNYYGSFWTVDGCGTFWQPYFVSASWSPYANGLWALYPGAGYSWVSPYPWGWLPFHSGAWSYCPSRGWGWQPGGAWIGLNNIAAATVRGTPAHMPGGILPKPPAGAKSSLVVSNQSPLVTSRQESPENFVFHKDSAGMGVPRGSLGKLNDFSNHVAQHGSANSQVYMAPSGESSHWNNGAVYHGPLSMHRGSAPDEAREAMWARQQQAAAANGAQPHNGQPAAGQLDRHGSQSGQTGAAGWQGHQPQGAANPNNAGWQGRHGGDANASAGNNHSWKNNAEASSNSAHTWNSGGASSGSGHGSSGGSGAGAGASHAGGGGVGGGHPNSSGGGNSGSSGTGANPASSGGSHK
jgi:hypothetical protein